MSADKKIDATKLPRREKSDEKNKSQEEFDQKINDNNELREKMMKKRKINYVVRDLPIY
ncbi:MAG: hypothetical protein JNK79_12745 [Chitinophagaceae bacterium]|nr:hypothetical protein [Chitinophagaceae bacterium]